METSDLHSMTRGFLPPRDPPLHLPEAFSLWDKMGKELPKLLVSDQLHSKLEAMPILSTKNLHKGGEVERGMLLLSFFGHAYIWGNEIKNRLPSSIAIPWYNLSKKLKRPPVLSYDSYALNNWRRINPARKVELGNIALLQNFLGGIDEEWFVLIHVDIEMKAAGALSCFKPLQNAVKNEEIKNVISFFKEIKHTLEKMCQTLNRMPEHCDPYIYYNRVRPYIHGWKDNPALPEGVIYEGVSELQELPQKFRGETGAQSSIIPAFDALLGVIHTEDPLRIYLQEMREYMPRAHLAFIEDIEASLSVRDYILENQVRESDLKYLYNDCLHLLSAFRKTHISFAAQYIQKQSQTSLANPTEVGTGGTPFMQYLRKHKDETLNYLIE